MLKILQARLQQYVNCELPDVQVGFRKGRGTRDQSANIGWIVKKQDNYKKASTSASLGASLVAQIVKNLPAMQETQVQFLDREDPLEKGTDTHSNILAWRIP